MYNTILLNNSLLIGWQEYVPCPLSFCLLSLHNDGSNSVYSRRSQSHLPTLFMERENHVVLLINSLVAE